MLNLPWPTDHALTVFEKMNLEVRLEGLRRTVILYVILSISAGFLLSFSIQVTSQPYWQLFDPSDGSKGRPRNQKRSLALSGTDHDLFSFSHERGWHASSTVLLGRHGTVFHAPSARRPLTSCFRNVIVTSSNQQIIFFSYPDANRSDRQVSSRHQAPIDRVWKVRILERSVM